MTLATASIKYIFGLKTDIIQNIFYHDESTVVYACGRHCILLHTENKSQKYITPSEKGLDITAMAMSPNRSYLAVALKSARPFVSVFNLSTLRRQKSLNTNDATADTIVSLSFSCDSRCLAALTGDPGWMIFCWNWEKSEIFVTTKVIHPGPLYSLIFNPSDSTSMCVVGNGILRSFRFAAGLLKPMNFPTIETQDFTCFCWVSDEKLLIGTSTGMILYVEGQYLKREINLDVDDKVTAVASFSEGFVCACGPGLVHFFDRIADNRKFYKKNRQAPLYGELNDLSKLQQQVVKGMVVSPSEEFLVVTTDMNQVYWTPINTEFHNRQMYHKTRFDLLTPGSHFAPITGLSVSVWKPLIATASEDSFIRIWNFDNFTLELETEFVAAVHSISIHPMGFFLLAGLTDRLYFMYILKDDLKKVKDFPIPECQVCNFSRGGHLFAATKGKVVQIYSSVTFDLIMNLKGHDGKVKTVIWNVDDSRVLTCGLDGAVYDWDYKSGRRIDECVLTTCPYTDITTHLTKKYIYAVGSDKTLKEILESEVKRTIPQDDKLLTSIAMSRSSTMLFAGTNTGYLLTFKYPVFNETVSYVGHSKEISRMVLTDDNLHLITVSKDASIIVWSVTEKDSLGVKGEKRVDWSEEILSSKSDLGENKMLSELRNCLEDLDTENKGMLQDKQICQKQMSDMKKEYTEQILEWENKYRTLEEKISWQNDSHMKELDEIRERHDHELQRIESNRSEKLLCENKTYEKIKNDMLTMKEHYEENISKMEERVKMEKHELTEQFQEKLNDLSKKVCDSEKENKFLKKEHEEIIRQNEMDFDTMMTRMKTRYEQELHEVRTDNTKKQREITFLNNRLEASSRDLKISEDEKRRCLSDKSQLNTIINSQEKDIHYFRTELEREKRTHHEEQTEFYMLKIKQLELEKLKGDVEFDNINEFKQLQENLKIDSMNMKRQIKEMKDERDNYAKQFADMKLAADSLRMKLVAANTQLNKERSILKKKTAILNRFQREFDHCWSCIHNPKKLKSCVQNFHQKYMSGYKDTIDSTETMVRKLEETIDRLRSLLRKKDKLLYTEKEKNRGL